MNVRGGRDGHGPTDKNQQQSPPPARHWGRSARGQLHARQPATHRPRAELRGSLRHPGRWATSDQRERPPTSDEATNGSV